MVTSDQIQKLADDIAAKFPEVEKIILFGSYAYGEPTQDSDVDLLVVMDHEGPGYRAASRIRLATDADFPLDLIVRSQAEVSAGMNRGDGFIQDILSEGALLHEAQHNGESEFWTVHTASPVTRLRITPPASRGRR